MSRWNYLVLPLVSLLCVKALAARSVTVTANGSGPIQLTNPTELTVTYDVQCFDSTGSSILNSSGQSLSPKASRAVGPSGKCAGDVAPVYSSSGMLRCKGTDDSVSFANAASLCGEHYTLCTIDKMAGWYLYSSTEFWLTPGTSSWHYSTDSQATWTTVSGTGSSAPVTTDDYAQTCKSSTPNYTFNCKAVNSSSYNADGANCCPTITTSNVAFCKVTITSSAPGAYLTSPQFKGGSPF